MKILSIDQGTTSTRAFVLAPSGRMTLTASLSHAQHYPNPGWVEQDAAELLRNLVTCLAAAESDADIGAVGIDNQGESCLAWDAVTGAAISPVIVWQDDRTEPDCAALRSNGADVLLRARAGLPLDPYFSATKLAWILRNIPEAETLLRQGRLRLGTTDAFFRDRLTGRFETDVTTASRTALMNLTTCQWDADLCQLFGVPMETLPAITPSTGDLGQITIGGRKVPLTASLVDQQAALYGHGCREPGDAKITFGTGAFALALTGAQPMLTGTAALPTIAWQKAGQAPVYALDGGVYTAAAAVNWAGSLGLFDDLASLSAFDHPSAAVRGLVFVPALAGLACPHWNRAARGAWLGLSQDTTRADMVQAVMEGIAFRMAEVIDTLNRAVPLSQVISIDGGMAGNPWFGQMLADVLGRRLALADTVELTALGTALLAAEAAGQAIGPPPPPQILSPRANPADAALAFQRGRAAVEVFARAD